MILASELSIARCAHLALLIVTPATHHSITQVDRIKGLTALAHGQPITPRATSPKSRPGGATTSPSALPPLALARTPSPGADGDHEGSSTRPGTAGGTDTVQGQYSPVGGTSSSPLGRYHLATSGGWAANSSFTNTPRGTSPGNNNNNNTQQQLQQSPSSTSRPSASALRGSSRAASRGLGTAPSIGGSSLARGSTAGEQPITQQLSRFAEAAAAAAQQSVGAAGSGAGGGGLSIRTRVNPDMGTGSGSPLGRGASTAAGAEPGHGLNILRSPALRVDSSASSRPGTSGQQQGPEQQLHALWSSYPGPGGSTSAWAGSTGGGLAGGTGSPTAGGAGVLPPDPYQPGSPGGVGSSGLGSQGALGSVWNLGLRRQASPPRQGALTAAGILWVRSQDVSAAPVLRQCLTYEEIARLKAEGRRPATAAGALQ
jgi:hypothetical protein